MKIANMENGVKKITVGEGEKLSVLGYRKGETPSLGNEILTLSRPMEIEIKIVKRLDEKNKMVCGLSLQELMLKKEGKNNLEI